jgi:hypothetical protein
MVPEDELQIMVDENLVEESPLSGKRRRQDIEMPEPGPGEQLKENIDPRYDHDDTLESSNVGMIMNEFLTTSHGQFPISTSSNLNVGIAMEFYQVSPQSFNRLSS